MRSKLVTVGILIAIVLLTLFLRAGIPFNSVFVNGETRFIEADAYHHMRLADSLNANFPNDITFDPYLGDDITIQPLLHWIIVLLGKVFGNLDAVGAWIPPICAALLVIPAYFIGHELFRSRWIGLLGALLIVLIPGEVQGRTLLSFTDHHCLEIFFSAVMLCFVVLGLTRSKWYWLGLMPLLALFWLAWSGTPLFAVMTTVSLLVWLVMTKRFGWLILTFAVPAVCLFSLIVISPQTFNSLLQIVWHNISMVYSVGGAGGSIMEASPIDFNGIWANFNLIGIVGIMGFVYVFYKGIVGRNIPLVVFSVWTLLLIVLMILQRRFAYYVALPIGILCGYILWSIISGLCSRRLNRADRRKGKSEVNWVTAGIGIALVVSVILFPNYKAQTTTNYPYQITPAWEECLYWLREHSPEPFSDENFYYANYEEVYRKESVEKGDLAKVNSNAYRVLSWWDYGHWIIRIGRRPVVCSPAGGQTVLAAKYLIGDELSEQLKILRVRYIVVDYFMVTGKYYAIPLWAGKNVKVENSLVYNLYYGRYSESKYKEVWHSSQTYKGQPQVKVFEIINW